MKRSQLQQIIEEVLEEEGNVTGAVGGYSTPKAFAKKGQGKNAATKQGERLGFKTVERPKRPSHTKMFDYLDEMQVNIPNAFVSEAEMDDSSAVKKTEEMGYKLEKVVKKSDKK